MREQERVLDVQADGRVLAAPSPGMLRLAHIIYALHALSVLIGITSAATIIGSFIFGLPSIIAVILNYVQRNEVRGTWLESHFDWQIRTFWYAFGWGALAFVILFTLGWIIIGIPIAIGISLLVGVWVVYRVGRGWLTLNNGRPIQA